ncbi:TadE family protein [Desulfobacula sp.]|uniref:TadE family protein n=1 Tax=Desulfobacula sp. TaxID=2593537 RepID=UPI0025C2110B|nr:TadE family protein [Desulfobacula sp.]
MIYPHKKTINNQEGAAAIELAFILPLLLLFIFGIIEFSLFLYNKQVITNAAREGARRGVIMRAPTRVVSAENAEIRARIQEFAESHLVTFGDDTFDAFDTNPETKNVSINPDPITDVDDPDRELSFESDLIVRATYEYKFLFLSTKIEPIYSGIGPINLTSTATMKME